MSKQKLLLFIGIFLTISVILFLNLVLTYAIEEGTISNIYLINGSKYLLYFFQFPFHFIFSDITNIKLYFTGYFINIFIYTSVLFSARKIKNNIFS